MGYLLHRRLEYFRTQALTRHGSSGTYTNRIKKNKIADMGTIPHTARQEIGEAITPDNMTQMMTGAKEKWNHIQATVREIMESGWYTSRLSTHDKKVSSGETFFIEIKKHQKLKHDQDIKSVF
ncbi:hypothetical protein JTB14_004318 [Gonioctena quinquepunctata]|nr:hypothetical protein JTB14_004318 [Gonioctena quinquepunctata]